MTRSPLPPPLRSRFLAVVLVFVAPLFASPTPAAAQAPAAPTPATAQSPAAKAARAQPCATPRAAVDALLYWQHPDHRDPARAAACIDPERLPEGLTPADAASQLKQIIDARGLTVEVDTLPAEPDYRDAQGRARVVLFPRQLPDVSVTRVGDRWMWSDRTLDALPDLYRQTFAVDLGALEARLPAWARSDVMGVAAWKLLALLLVILLAFLVRLVVMWFTATRLRQAMERMGARWGADLLARLDAPVGALAAAGTVALLLPGLRLPVTLTGIFLLAARVLAAVSAVWLAYRLVDVATAWLQTKAARTKTKLDDQLVPLVRTSLKVFTLALGIIFVLQNLNVDVASLLAGLGLGGLAFALAARDTVANFFGAITIFLDRPFQIGDWVVVAGTEGIVERVGFRSTRVRTFYNSLVAVPNSKVADSVVDNYGARVYRRTTTTLAVTYDTPPDRLQAFVEGIRAVIQANPYTRKDYYEVHFNGFGDSSLDVMVYFFFQVASWSEELREKHNVFMEILRLAEDLGVSFAFPTRTLHLDSQAPPREVETRRPQEEDLAALVNAYGPGGRRARPKGHGLTGGWLAGMEAPGSLRESSSQRGEGDEVD